MEHLEGTFLVTHVDDRTALLRDVRTGRLLTVEDHADLAVDEGLEATLETADQLAVTWTIGSVTERWTVEVVESDLEPTARARTVAADLEEGAARRLERAGHGEIHVLNLDPAAVQGAVAEIQEDVATRERAVRLGAVRVEVRWDETAGILSVRYLPD